VRGIDGHKGDDGREHKHECAETVDAEVILDARRAPRRCAPHAHGSVGGRLVRRREPAQDLRWW